MGVYLLGSTHFHNNPLSLLPILIPFFLLLWVYLDTQYQIKDEQLHYRCAFLRGKFPILGINSITVGKTLWSGTKPALARKGLIIKYNRYDEVYIAPINNSAMLEALLAINPDIKVHYVDGAGQD